MSTIIDGTTGITTDGLTATSVVIGTSTVGLGIGQTYSNVTSTRTVSTTYTNSTGKAIFVIITAGGSSNNYGNISVSINGASSLKMGVWNNVSSTAIGLASFIVPAGDTYNVTLPVISGGGSASIISWVELR